MSSPPLTDLNEARERGRNAINGTDVNLLEHEIARLETNQNAVRIWMDAIDEILGCEFEMAERSPTGKLGYRCRFCTTYTNAPVRGSVEPCKEKVRAARNVAPAARP